VPINRIGVTMGYPEIAALIALVGRTAALEILLEGRVFDAEEAKEKGLVTRIVADDQVVAEAYAAATRIATGAPLVNRWHKKFARRVLDGTPITQANSTRPTPPSTPRISRTATAASSPSVRLSFEGGSEGGGERRASFETGVFAPSSGRGDFHRPPSIYLLLRSTR